MKTTRYTKAFLTLRAGLLSLLILLCWDGFAQYKYGIKPLGLNAYRETVKASPEKELVDLEEYIPGIKLDIRYATTNNFTGQQIYNLPKAYARKPVAEALKKAQADFKALGYEIKIFDAYRPYRATVKFYEVYKDTTYVASPYRGSRHNRGCAIDLTLVYSNTGEEVKMPTEYDSFKKEAWPSTPMSDPEIRKNRALLIATLEKYGFRVNGSEWWHFDFRGYKKYEILDIEFEELVKK